VDTILQSKACPECDYTFKVMDLNNWVCNNCYSYEIPKYLNGDSTRTRRNKRTLNHLIGRSPELIQALIDEAKARGDYKTEAEKEFVKRLCRNLKRQGKDYEAWKACETGEIDIFLHGDPPTIIEAKAHEDAHSLMTALGQLLFYCMSYPDARLFIATPRKIPKASLKILNLYNIRQWGRFTKKTRGLVYR